MFQESILCYKNKICVIYVYVGVNYISPLIARVALNDSGPATFKVNVDFIWLSRPGLIGLGFIGLDHNRRVHWNRL